MATKTQCHEAMLKLASLLSTTDTDTSAMQKFERDLNCHLTDLDIDFRGKLRTGQLTDIAEGAAPDAQIKIRLSSDDLVALMEGELSFAPAWATGRVKIEASFADLIKMRSFL